MTKNEERCQRLMINRAYENGVKAGYEKGFKDGIDSAVNMLAKRFRKDIEKDNSETVVETGGDE